VIQSIGTFHDDLSSISERVLEGAGMPNQSLLGVPRGSFDSAMSTLHHDLTALLLKT
jgi:hypothetical protein